MCRTQWTMVTLCLTLSSAWTYAIRLQCAATERDGLRCLSKQKIVSSSPLLTRIYFLLKELDEKVHVSCTLCETHRPYSMLFSFTNQVSVQLDLFKYW